MPNRVVREGLLDSKSVSTMSDAAQILYGRLMLVVDDFGRYEADPALLRVKCFPRLLDRWSVERVRDALQEVSQTPTDDGFPVVLVYFHGNKQYLEIANFNQRLRAKRARYPEPTVRNLLATRQTDVSHSHADDGHVSDIRGQLGVVAFSSLPICNNPSNNLKEGSIKEFPKKKADAPAWDLVNEAWKWFKAEFPSEVNDFVDLQLFIAVMETEADLAALRMNLPLWKQSHKWIDGCIHSSKTFLSERIFKITPKIREPTKNKQQISSDQWDETGETRRV